MGQSETQLFTVNESDLSGLGNLYGVYDSIQLACQAAKDMLDSVLLYDTFGEDKRPIDSMEINHRLENPNKSLVVYSDSGSTAILMRSVLNKNNW